jgi:hypothetical protein
VVVVGDGVDWVLAVDDVVGVVCGVLGVLCVAVGVEVEVLGGGVLLVVGVLVVGVQLTPTTVAPAGKEIEDGATPGGKSRLSVSWMPPNNVTLTTHGSAEAVGRAAMHITASAVIAPTTTFRLRNTVVNLLPRVCLSKSLAPRPLAAWRGRYCLTPWFATVNRRPWRPSGARQLYSI